MIGSGSPTSVISKVLLKGTSAMARSEDSKGFVFENSWCQSAISSILISGRAVSTFSKFSSGCDSSVFFTFSVSISPVSPVSSGN